MVDFNQFLDFERPVVEIETELLRLRQLVEAGDVGQVSEVEKLERRLEKVREDVYGKLSPYQRVRLSRHFERPLTLDYIERFVTDFEELHGDRLFAEDAALVCGIGRFENKPVAVIGQQRGRSTTERVKRNFGMAQPEGYRKAQRIFAMAEKFKMPLLNFIDTQGAYPGLEAEARGQAEAIARNLLILSRLKTQIVSTVIGEGGSGGALAIGICDRLLMLENSCYSVITPEGCASILWGKADAANVGEYAKVAAESLKLTAQELLETGVVEEVVREPMGGAHRDHDQAAELLAEAIGRHLHQLKKLSVDELLEARYQKFRKIGALN